jgi:hypothetical protein
MITISLRKVSYPDGVGTQLYWRSVSQDFGYSNSIISLRAESGSENLPPSSRKIVLNRCNGVYLVFRFNLDAAGFSVRLCLL